MDQHWREADTEREREREKTISIQSRGEQVLDFSRKMSEDQKYVESTENW